MLGSQSSVFQGSNVRVRYSLEASRFNKQCEVTRNETQVGWLQYVEERNAVIFVSLFFSVKIYVDQWAQRLINLEITVLVQSLRSSNVELSEYLDGRPFKGCLSVAANP